MKKINRTPGFLHSDSNFEYFGYRINGAELITNVYSINSNTEYKIDITEKTIVCIIHADDYDKTFSGKTKLRDGDKFDLQKGMQIARLKATLKLKKFEYNFSAYMVNDISDQIDSLKSLLLEGSILHHNSMERIASLKRELEKLMDRHAD